MAAGGVVVFFWEENDASFWGLKFQNQGLGMAEFTVVWFRWGEKGGHGDGQKLAKLRWSSTGKRGPMQKVTLSLTLSQCTARNSYRGRVWQICLEHASTFFHAQKAENCSHLGLSACSTFTLDYTSVPSLFSCHDHITWSFNFPPSFPVPMNEGSSRLPPKPPQAIPFVLGGKPRKRLSGESLRAQWKAWKLNKVEWLRCHFEPSLEPKKKAWLQIQTAGVLDLFGKNSWKKLMDFFLGCFLNIWKNKDGGGQCFGEKISSFHRRRDCTIAALKSEKAVSGTQQKIDVAHPQSLTWNLKMMVSIRNPLFQGSNLTWNLKMNPWKKEIPIGNHHFYPRKLTAGTWKCLLRKRKNTSSKPFFLGSKC